MTQLLSLQGVGPPVPSLWEPVSGSPAPLSNGQLLDDPMLNGMGMELVHGGCSSTSWAGGPVQDIMLGSLAFHTVQPGAPIASGTG
jgi:hypothetical protein